MTVDSKVISMYEKLREANLTVPVPDQTPAKERKQELEAALLFMGKPEKVEGIENRKISRLGEVGEIPIRIYFPKEGVQERAVEHDVRQKPVVVFIHGGGFVAGDLISVEETCCMISNHAGVIVVSVDYRLAPEHKFPSGLNDCHTATLWALENASSLGGDSSRVVIAGDSAGGNLATTVCLMIRNNSGLKRISLQTLIYPVTDFSRDMSKYSGVEYGPSKEEMDWYSVHYLRTGEDVMNPLVSPILAKLEGLPDTLMITAENDPLREQDLDYARNLEAAGVKVTLLNYPGMVHGFFTVPNYFAEARNAIDELAKMIRSL